MESYKRPHGFSFVASAEEKGLVEEFIAHYQAKNPTKKIGLRAAILEAIEELKGE